MEEQPYLKKLKKIFRENLYYYSKKFSEIFFSRIRIWRIKNKENILCLSDDVFLFFIFHQLNEKKKSSERKFLNVKTSFNFEFNS